MNTEDRDKLQYHLQEAAKILFNNTPSEEVKDFDSIEMTLRKHVLDTVEPKISQFFLQDPQGKRLDKPET